MGRHRCLLVHCLLVGLGIVTVSRATISIALSQKDGSSAAVAPHPPGEAWLDEKMSPQPNHNPVNLTEAEILTILMKGYDSRLRPRPAGKQKGPVVVEIDIYIRSLSSIDEINMKYTVDLLVRQHWRDPRLRYEQLSYPDSYVTADIHTLDGLWKPDLFFSNEKDGHFHNITMPNVLGRIFPDGEILYSIRLTMDFFCEMDLIKYPFDEQVCHIYFGSFSYTTKDVVFKWQPHNTYSINKRLTLPQFTLTNVTTNECLNNHYTGNFSCLRVDLYFLRDFGYHMIQSYVPTFLLVICSWVSFWLDVDAIPARISLGVTTLLTQTTQSSGVRTGLPKVSYAKAIDVWMGLCTSYIFGALLEFALVNYVSRKADGALRNAALHVEGKNKSDDESDDDDEDELRHNGDVDLPEEHEPHCAVRGQRSPANLSAMYEYQTVAGSRCRACGTKNKRPSTSVLTAMYDFESDTTRSSVTRRQGVTTPPKVKAYRKQYKRYRRRAKLIDKISRVLFPITFIIFSFVYWLNYIRGRP